MRDVLHLQCEQRRVGLLAALHLSAQPRDRFLSGQARDKTCELMMGRDRQRYLQLLIGGDAQVNADPLLLLQRRELARREGLRGGHLVLGRVLRRECAARRVTMVDGRHHQYVLNCQPLLTCEVTKRLARPGNSALVADC